MELLLGCGSRRDKIIAFGPSKEWTELVTLDNNAAHSPDWVWDLNEKPWPFEDGAFSEVHAYEVLEHLGSGPGDYLSFFADFSEIWRVLEPGGLLCATCPAFGSPWVWGDPSHRRQISPESLVFLSQAAYEQQVGKTPMSDFRSVYSADFEPLWMEVKEHTFAFVLKAVK